MSSMDRQQHPPANQAFEEWERAVQARARRFVYPPAPDLTRSPAMQAPPRMAASAQNQGASMRRLGWALAAILLVCAVLWSFAPVRAWVTEVLQLGAVRIFVQPPTSSTPATPSAVTPQPTAAGAPTAAPWAGATTLVAAAEQLTFTLSLPTWPQDLGLPDHVYVQDLVGPAVFMVWDSPQGGARLSLHALSSAAIVHKFAPVTVAKAQVNGKEALWTDGPYLVQVGWGDMAPQRLITGHVLIWQEGDITYRLETDLALEDAVRVAESLAPWAQNQ